MSRVDEFNKKYAHAYLQTLPFRNIPNPPIILIFSGVPGSGKTTLARRLVEDYRAQYLDHDAIRSSMLHDGVDLKEVFMLGVSDELERAIFAHDKNKFIIIDGSVDRTWKFFFELTEDLGATPIIIRLSLPVDVARQRLQQRDSKDSALATSLNKYKSDFDECVKHVAADLTLGEDYSYSDVADFIRTKISAQS